MLANYDQFGWSACSLGDLDGDGVTDLAVGALGDSAGGVYSGAVYVLFLNSNGTVKSSQKIAGGEGGGPSLAARDYFSISLTSLGGPERRRSDGSCRRFVGQCCGNDLPRRTARFPDERRRHRREYPEDRERHGRWPDAG